VVIDGLTHQIMGLEAELSERFEGHPDAEIITSLPGLSSVLGARVLAEFGDDPTRYVDARARRRYAGTAPITRASGTRLVVLARVARNRRLFDACYWWAFSSLNASPGARRYYDAHRRKGKTHHPGAPCSRQPLGRDPAWLPRPPRVLPRGRRLGRVC